ncbi:hypothetical protein Tco_0992317 [Tanacetum coccineum]|uniref:Uncharacterized protein n=1 Tax=Tanacetum coccineum TaxID=301880 RepID=A0ABQ5F2F7_9ASTR
MGSFISDSVELHVSSVDSPLIFNQEVGAETSTLNVAEENIEQVNAGKTTVETHSTFSEKLSRTGIDEKTSQSIVTMEFNYKWVGQALFGTLTPDIVALTLLYNMAGNWELLPETYWESLSKEILGAIIQRDIRRYYPKRYWEILPKEILGDTTQRDIRRYYPKRYWEILLKEIFPCT